MKKAVIKNPVDLYDKARKLAGSILQENAPNISALSVYHGPHTLRKAGQGERFWQFREYQDGDSPRSIDWRQSAKTERVFVREKQQENLQHVYFFCDFSASMDYQSESSFYKKSDTARILSLALALLHSEQGDRVHIIGYPTTIGHDPNHQLAEQFFEHKQEILDQIHANQFRSNSTIYLAGDFIDPIESYLSAFEEIASISGASTQLIQILDPAELDFPFEGHVQVQNIDKSYKQKIDHASSLQKAYKQKINEHIQELRQACLERNIKSNLVRSDENLAKKLQEIWIENEF